MQDGIHPATTVSMEALRRAMLAAFADYAVPMQPSPAVFDLMMRQRGLNRGASRIAARGGKVVALWLVSVRGDAGYLIVSGTLPEARGTGLARGLAADSLAHLAQMGVTRFETEVMVGNKPALALYERLGMQRHRALICYEGLTAAGTPSHAPVRASWTTTAPRAAALRDWPPSWQNSDAALQAVPDQIKCVVLRDAAGLAGYAVLVPLTSTLAQIAVRPDMRRSRMGRALVQAVMRVHPKPLRMLNAQTDDAGFADFMASLGAGPTVQQHHLMMPLSGPGKV